MIMKNNALLIVGTSLVAFALIFSISRDVSNGDCDPMIQDFFNQSFSGVVVGKKRTKAANVSIVYLNDSSTIIHLDAMDKYSVHDHLRIGDTIRKKKHTLTCWLFREDSTYRYSLNNKDCKKNR